MTDLTKTNRDKITKETIASHVKDKFGFSSSICEDIITQIFSEIVEITKSGSNLSIKNFGTWKVNHKNSRPGLNIKTGEKVEIKARSVLRFSPSQSFKHQINNYDARS